MGYLVVGKTIKTVRCLSKAELLKEGWDDREGAMALVLDDGAIIYASRDYEGNGPGALFGRHGKNGFYVTKE